MSDKFVEQPSEPPASLPMEVWAESVSPAEKIKLPRGDFGVKIVNSWGEAWEDVPSQPEPISWESVRAAGWGLLAGSALAWTVLVIFYCLCSILTMEGCC